MQRMLHVALGALIAVLLLLGSAAHAGDGSPEGGLRGDGVTFEQVSEDEPVTAGPGEAATWWVVPTGLILLSGAVLLYGRRAIAEPRR